MNRTIAALLTVCLLATAVLAGCRAEVAADPNKDRVSTQLPLPR